MIKRVKVTPGDIDKRLTALGRITAGKMIRADELTDDELDSIAGLFQPWHAGKSVLLADIRTYDGIIYECLQPHTTQADWPPDNTPALWKKKSAPGVVPAWVQPTGAHDAYDIGAIVTHNDKSWLSGIDANTTVPGENSAFDWWTETDI